MSDLVVVGSGFFGLTVAEIAAATDNASAIADLLARTLVRAEVMVAIREQLETMLAASLSERRTG